MPCVPLRRVQRANFPEHRACQAAFMIDIVVPEVCNDDVLRIAPPGASGLEIAALASSSLRRQDADAAWPAMVRLLCVDDATSLSWLTARAAVSAGMCK